MYSQQVLIQYVNLTQLLQTCLHIDPSKRQLITMNSQINLILCLKPQLSIDEKKTYNDNQHNSTNRNENEPKIAIK